MAKPETILKAIREAALAKRTENAQVNAIGLTLAKYGCMAIPKVETGRDEGGATIRVYVWKGTPAGDVVLVTGPSIEPEVHEASSLLPAEAPPGGYIQTSVVGGSKAAKLTGGLARAQERGAKLADTVTRPERKPAPRKPKAPVSRKPKPAKAEPPAELPAPPVAAVAAVEAPVAEWQTPAFEARIDKLLRDYSEELREHQDTKRATQIAIAIGDIAKRAGIHDSYEGEARYANIIGALEKNREFAGYYIGNQGKLTRSRIHEFAPGDAVGDSTRGAGTVVDRVFSADDSYLVIRWDDGTESSPTVGSNMLESGLYPIGRQTAAPARPVEDRPEEGKVYSLTGISQGKSWAESEVKPEPPAPEPAPAGDPFMEKLMAGLRAVKSEMG